MKKIIFLTIVSAILLMGARCKSDENFANNFIPIDKQPTTTADATPNNNDAVNKTAAERGMIGVRVINIKSKKGVPSVPLVIPYSNIIFTTNHVGYVEVPVIYKKIYVPKIISYKMSGEINLVPQIGKNTFDITLEPEQVDKGYELVFLTGKVFPTSDSSSVIQGQIKYNGIIMPNLPILVAGMSGIDIKTDKEGKFKTVISLSEGGLRLYFPTLNIKKQFQIDIVKSNTIDLQINP